MKITEAVVKGAFDDLEKRFRSEIERSEGGEKLSWMVYRGLFEIGYELEFRKLFCHDGFIDVYLENEKAIDLIKETSEFILLFYNVVETYLRSENTKELRVNAKDKYGLLNYDFDRLCKILDKNKTKRYELASRVFGLALGVYFQKAADVACKKVCSAKLRSYIENSDMEEPCKSEILKYSLLYLKYKKKHAKVVMSRLEESDAVDELEKYEGLMAYGLLRKNTDIVRKKKQPIDKMATNSLVVILEKAYSYAWVIRDGGEKSAPRFMNEDCAKWIDYLEYEGIIG